ncbi:MAG: hypothetical protein JSV33_12690 [bacterium]|nr:MAG: hypothetical protein JSV33_12690 [bacterium]
MIAWIELWVRLKVVDLVAQTAWMTLTEKLDLRDDLCGLKHYSYWGMDADGIDAETILDDVDRVIRMDSAFTNQNKHCYRLRICDGTPQAGGSGLAIPSGRREGCASTGDLALEKDLPIEGDEKRLLERGGVYVFDCLIRERRGDRERAFEDRLNGRLKAASVSHLKHGELWRMLILADGLEEAQGKLERMLVTRSRREGLLLNPHYQRYEIVSSGPVASGEGLR